MEISYRLALGPVQPPPMGSGALPRGKAAGAWH